MSASDAAPLPRLGEVFFDVRGNSRSMRLSWYADTGVAVFSIWQGGRCTGTFRLPIDDLPRMIEILERGPHGRQGGPQLRGPGPGHVSAAGDDHRTAAYQQADYDDHGQDQAHGYGARRPEAAGYEPAGQPEYAGYAQGDEYGPDPGYAAERRYAGSDGYAAGDDYGDRDVDSTGTYWRDEGGYRLDGGQPEAAAAGQAGYSQQRFVPPYLRPHGDGYPNDNPAAGPAHGGAYPGAAYPADRSSEYAEGDAYRSRARPQPGYSGASDYRLTADTADGSRHSAGKHSSQRTSAGQALPPAEDDPDAVADQVPPADFWSRPGR